MPDNESVAVLYRTNSQSRAIEDALTREAVPYRIVGNVRFYERKEVKDALAYLRLLAQPGLTMSVCGGSSTSRLAALARA